MSERLILVVEDNPTLQLVLERALKLLDQSFEIVTTGEEALESVAEEMSMIFMDIGLPGIDGLQTTQKIREKERKLGWQRKPIIALTAHSDRDLCIESGMDDYIQKPALIDDLRSMIEKWSSH